MASSSNVRSRLGPLLLTASLLGSGLVVAQPVPLRLAGSFAVLAHSAYASHGSSGQGYLGVDIRTVSDATVKDLHLRETHGVVVIMVDHDGPAWKAGVRDHDVVQSVNGASIDSEEQLRHVLREMQPGRTVQIGVSRDGTTQVMTATMANRDDIGRRAWEQHYVLPAPVDTSITASEDTAVPPPPQSQGKGARSFGHSLMPGHLLPVFPSYTGAVVDEIGPQLAEYFGLNGRTGLLVQSVETNSPAAAAGMHAGDVVLRINGTVMGSRSDWNRAFHDSKGHTVSVVVMREHHEQVLTVVPDSKRRGASQPGPAEPEIRGKAAMLSLLSPR